MQYLLELLKIVEGAVNADRTKVVAYTEQLAAKIEQDGEKQAADRLRRTLRQSKVQHLSPAKLGSPMRLPVDGESRLALAGESLLEPKDVQLFLEPDVAAQVEEFLRFIRSADRLLAGGVDISPSLIAYGPPGCGKTELARLIAAQLHLPLLTARLDSMISSFLGSTAKNIRSLFEHAVSRPCVLFLDEFDAIAKLRDDQQELGELKRVVVSLLQNIDYLDSKTVLIAATNHEHLLDPAVWRRFAYKIHMVHPSEKVRSFIFGHFLSGYAPSDQVELFAAATEGLSGSDIRQLSENAKRDAIINGQTTVDSANLLKRILQMRGVIKNANGSKDIAAQIREARKLAPKVFTYPRLSQIFDRSTGYICNILKAKGIADA